MSTMTLYMLIGITASVVIAILFFVMVSTGGSRAAERLDALVGKRRKESAADLLLKQTLQESDKKNLLDAITPDIPSLQTLFDQAECNIKPSTLFGISMVLALVAATLSYMMVRNYWLPPIVGLCAMTVPFLWLLNKRRVRLKKFAEQLPDSLELVARALRAGHSLAAGMHVVAEEMPSPIADEFGRVYEEQNLGIALEDAMKSMCGRVPNLDLRFFVTAVAIQRQTGGDLAEILDKIGYVVRERYKILGQVKALTAEGRLSGVVLIALPFLLLVVMLHLKPDYVAMLWEHKMGVKMSIGAIVLMIIGAICIKKIVDIKV